MEISTCVPNMECAFAQCVEPTSFDPLQMPVMTKHRWAEVSVRVPKWLRSFRVDSSPQLLEADGALQALTLHM